MPKSPLNDSSFFAPRVFRFMAEIIFLLFLAVVSVQDINAASYDSLFNIEVDPEKPAPFDTVKLRATSFSIDLSRTEIFWYVDDKLVSSGIGKTSYSLKAGDVGDISSVDVAIKAGGFGIVGKNLTIKPSQVNILWEAVNSYTPPFYKGKALPATQSGIKIVAVPYLANSTGKKISASELVYKWKRDSKYRDLNDQSGYGKDQIKITGNILKGGEEIEVEVSNLDNSLSGVGNVFIPFADPKVIFYQKSPSLGILYKKALNNGFNLSDKELTVAAEPYFISAKQKLADYLSYQWKVGGKKIDNSSSDKSLIVLRRENPGKGNSLISLNIDNTSKLVEQADGNFNLSFGDDTGGNNLFFNR